MAVDARVTLLLEIAKITGRSFYEIYDDSRKMNQTDFVGFCYRMLFSAPVLEAPIVTIEHNPSKLLE